MAIFTNTTAANITCDSLTAVVPFEYKPRYQHQIHLYGSATNASGVTKVAHINFTVINDAVDAYTDIYSAINSVAGIPYTVASGFIRNSDMFPSIFFPSEGVSYSPIFSVIGIQPTGTSNSLFVLGASGSTVGTNTLETKLVDFINVFKLNTVVVDVVQKVSTSVLA